MKVFCFRVSGELSDRAYKAHSKACVESYLKVSGITDYYGLREASEFEIVELFNSGSFMN